MRSLIVVVILAYLGHAVMPQALRWCHDDGCAELIALSTTPGTSAGCCCRQPEPEPVATCCHLAASDDTGDDHVDDDCCQAIIDDDHQLALSATGTVILPASPAPAALLALISSQHARAPPPLWPEVPSSPHLRAQRCIQLLL
ncbi:MAG: hypothetical protein ACYTF0_01505 [Planctomycetota bacterium]|jgi:hypothetical protein